MAAGAALMPDAHVGYGLPIGGVLALEGAVIPYAVGVDIACRMKLSVIDLPPEWLDTKPERLTAALEADLAAEADRRLDVALTVLYTVRGTPVVYYGTEIAMRGRGDSYDLPIGASSREDMDFTRLAASAFDERIKALADARRLYPALRRGTQRTLVAPGA